MNWIDPYLFFLTALALCVVFVSLALLKPPRKLSRILLAIAAGLCGIFMFLTVLELVIDDFDWMLRLRNMQQIAIILISVFLLGYARELYHAAPAKTMKWIGILGTVSIIDILLVYTDPLHGLMRSDVAVVQVWNFTEISIQSTALNSFLGGVYPFVLTLVTIFLLLRNMFDVPKQYRVVHWLSACVVSLPVLAVIITPMLTFEIPGKIALPFSSMALLLNYCEQQKRCKYRLASV
ncbi:hypothetical protein JCM21714_3786 [Gracilibacillus boraciitolerans JCM 21714]|uniref:Histidine kinase N-terminal 7TM region domain-containing protein n=1 Tax=Gracilibacillus boraciitolerans JCM 21714 TaxID=1298598 RepID=W4VN95_9BACI|nr:histidine kinase N-terminal 7TM domain-containing protein [Gracilibacillus boraciitolerans]GAE94611.1 hypothetical protein JCM21714_3786 [Gracilibacillus boraciitolerans JCM 21714]